jgi:iron complex outermembrane recepter protein
MLVRQWGARLEGLQMFKSRKNVEKKAAKSSANTVTTVSALLAISAVANGQNAPADTAADGAESIEEVVVTGFRASLDKAIEAKKEQVGAIDMIAAEDIADFPDLNLAESLQRVPGVAIARDAGEGRQISVRGLGPQFTRVRINGIEAMSANGGTDAAGGTNRGRNFDFNTFASELFNNITVRKSGAAEVEEGSLGATVDLQTARPFDYDGFTAAGSLQLGYNDLNEESDPRAAFLVSNTFADGKIGALLSVAYTERKLLDEGASTVRWMRGGTAANNFGPLDPTYTGTATLAQLNNAFRPRIPRYDNYQHEQERIGVTASLQFAPTDATSLNLDALYAKFDASRQEIFLQSHVFSTGGATGINDVNVVRAEIDDTNTIVYGVFNDVDIRSEARFDELTTEFTQVTLDSRHAFSDTFSGNLLVGFAEANHDNPVQTTLLFDANNIDGYSYDFRGDRRLPLITYGTADVTNPAIWQLTQIRLRPQSTINSFQNVSMNLEWAPSENFRIKAGPQWKEFTFKTTELRRWNGTSNANIETTIPAAATIVPVANYSAVTTFGQDLDLPSGSITQWLSPDLASATGLLDLDNSTTYRLGILPALGNNNEIVETDRGAFIQTDFSFGLGDRTLRGNAGVRYVETDVDSLGYTFTTATGLVEQRAKGYYSDFLPSFNLVYDFSDELLFRIGASRVMTRPNLGQLAPGAAVSVSGNNRTVTSGNPDLDPFRARAYDASIEWYFAEESLLSLAYFRKDISSFVTNIRSDIPFSENTLGLPDSVAVAACGATPGCSPSALWAFTQPTNTEGGRLQGFEVSYQQPFTFLPGVWSNFGTILNYTGVESEVSYVNSLGQTTKADLAGLSDTSWNATLYFDNQRFSARVAAAYRSEFLTTIPGRDGNDVEGTAETLNIDFSSTFNINDKFSVSFEALNLTDEVQDQWVDSIGDRLSFYHHQGTQYFLGARFKY